MISRQGTVATTAQTGDSAGMWPFRSSPPADPADAFRRDVDAHFADFLRVARGREKPRGLRWVSVEPTGEVVFGREIRSGRPVALAGVRVAFEPIAGEDMEDVAAAYEGRDATALFWFDGRNWGSDGRVLFNLTPGDAAKRLSEELEAAN